ncbi:MAG: LysR family transcriptional regulator [Pseudomonadota bacterium]
MTYRLPSLNTLRAFEAAARHLSFQTAANEIGVTSGAVSQQVRKLEHSLGLQLFRRLPHGLLLTEAGETYLPKITKVFDDLTEATEAIAPDMNGKKFMVGLCPKAAALLPKNWPLCDESLKAHVRASVSTSDIEQVRNGSIDCLIRKNGGPYGQLELFRINRKDNAEDSGDQLHLICKTGFARCRQTEELILSLESSV